MNLRLLAAAAIAAASTSAYAADFAADGPAQLNWTGAYIGAQIGYNVGGNADYFYAEDSAYNYNHNLRGLLGGVYIGYNHQLENNFVLGAEADVSFGDVHGSAVDSDDRTYGVTAKFDRTFSARARIGYAFDRFLPYIAGGVTVGHLKVHETDHGSYYADGAKNLVGWTVGAGAEYALTNNLFLRGEYRYARFSRKDVEAYYGEGSYIYSIKADTHDVRLGLTYRF
ncbi:porin [Nitratireductor aestuarii]|uniref:Porin n=1 Tax=Nitratireductor aestuarii TaxID=1735103 RepID=A0A916RV62_9HYPH|nr:outer membrane protein [Nitratireductor aestuarii]GGA70747.1 porin [Nitratireductor aestuarii]